jgi:SAM-dependent methyltransferase
MEREQQQRYYELGKSYWWLSGKYRVVEDVVRRALPPAGSRPRLLDLGCGPGNMLDLLTRHGDVYGADYSVDALRFCREREQRRLFRADFHGLPVKSECFDLVTCIDVIEHLRDDQRALAEIGRVLRPSGLLVLTVPAFQSLWGDHDELYGHYRRYRAGPLRQRLEQAGLRVLKATYFEPLFFAPLWLYRKLKRLLPPSGSLEKRDDFVAFPRALNSALTQLIAAERFAIRHMSLPFGVTLLALARKPG